MKVANIDREILHNFWTTWGISMKLSGKMCLTIILKVTKNQGFTPMSKSIHPFSAGSSYLKNVPTHQIRIKKTVNKRTVDYHSSPSEFTSRIYPLIFLWTPKGFISPEYFLNFFSNLYISPWLQKCFKFMVLRLLKNTFVSLKTESVYPWPQAKLSPRFLSWPIQTE